MSRAEMPVGLSLLRAAAARHFPFWEDSLSHTINIRSTSEQSAGEFISKNRYNTSQRLVTTHRVSMPSCRVVYIFRLVSCVLHWTRFQLSHCTNKGNWSEKMSSCHSNARTALLLRCILALLLIVDSLTADAILLPSDDITFFGRYGKGRRCRGWVRRQKNALMALRPSPPSDLTRCKSNHCRHHMRMRKIWKFPHESALHSYTERQQQQQNEKLWK